MNTTTTTTTIGLMERLLDTMDAEAFVKGVQQFDVVTQRQCLLKALRELRKLPTVRLHGRERTRAAVETIRHALEKETVKEPRSVKITMSLGN